MLNEFEKNSKFNLEQIKNFGTPKGAQGPTNLAQGPSSTTNASATQKMGASAAVGGKKPKIRSPNKE